MEKIIIEDGDDFYIDAGDGRIQHITVSFQVVYLHTFISHFLHGDLVGERLGICCDCYEVTENTSNKVKRAVTT